MSSADSNKGRQHFTLGSDLRVQSVSRHSGPSGGLMEDAARKHTATYAQPVQGPLELSTMQHMARAVHDGRGGKPAAQNTVAIFHESAHALSPAVSGAKGKSLDVRSATVFDSLKDKASTPTHNSGATTMHFDKDNNNNHLNRVE